MNNANNPEFLDNTDPEKNYNFYRQDHGGMVTEENGVADKLLKNNDLYRSMKGDWSRTSMNRGNNIKVTTGRQDGKFFITREQMNTEAIKQHCRDYRAAAEAGIPDPLAPIGEDGKLQHKWMELPFVISIRISDQYFGGMPWNAIKQDRTLKAQFYRVVQQEYPEYICYPGGKLPIPVAVPYPTRTG
jgi:hypothetical protein